MNTGKIVVLNLSGNVGKTTDAVHLILPRMGNAELLSVETINDPDNLAEHKFSGRDFTELLEIVDNADSIVVDVGASNVEAFFTEMSKSVGSESSFDLFVVPTVPELKQIKDTINTIVALQDFGVDQHKIRVVFNKVQAEFGTPAHVEVQRAFKPIFDMHNSDSKKNQFLCNPHAFIPSSDLFARIGAEPIDSILSTTVDELKALLLTTSDPDQRFVITRKMGTVRLAQGIKKHLDACFKALMSDAKEAGGI